MLGGPLTDNSSGSGENAPFICCVNPCTGMKPDAPNGNGSAQAAGMSHPPSSGVIPSWAASG